jgi:hypothetical protein
LHKKNHLSSFCEQSEQNVFYISNYFNPNISPLKMLSMKNVILILATAFLGFTTMSFDLFHPSIIANEEDIEIVFTKSMDKAQLEAIRKDLSEKGIILTYKTAS